MVVLLFDEVGGGGGGAFNDMRPGNTIKNRVGPPPPPPVLLLPVTNDGHREDVDCTARLRKKTSDPLQDCCNRFPGVR